jgi:hypothetical protein
MMFRRLATMCLSAALAFSTISCSDDDDDVKDVFDGEIVAIKSATISTGNSRKNAEGNTYYRHYLILTGTGIEVDGDKITGKGDMLTVSFNSSAENIADGTYTLEGYSEILSDKLFDVNYSFFFRNYEMSKSTYEPGSVNGFDELTMTISKSGANYTIKITGKAYEMANPDAQFDKTKPSKLFKAEYKGTLHDMQGS